MQQYFSQGSFPSEVLEPLAGDAFIKGGGSREVVRKNDAAQGAHRGTLAEGDAYVSEITAGAARRNVAERSARDASSQFLQWSLSLQEADLARDGEEDSGDEERRRGGGGHGNRSKRGLSEDDFDHLQEVAKARNAAKNQAQEELASYRLEKRAKLAHEDPLGMLEWKHREEGQLASHGETGRSRPRAILSVKRAKHAGAALAPEAVGSDAMAKQSSDSAAKAAANDMASTSSSVSASAMSLSSSASALPTSSLPNPTRTTTTTTTTTPAAKTTSEASSALAALASFGSDSSDSEGS